MCVSHFDSLCRHSVSVVILHLHMVVMFLIVFILDLILFVEYIRGLGVRFEGKTKNKNFWIK